MVAGSMYWKTDRQKRKEFDAAVQERKRRERSEAWIRELEIRDEEERELKAARETRRKAAARRDGTAASSMVDERERRKGTLDMLAELVYGRK